MDGSIIKINDLDGNKYEYDSSTGLISLNDAIVSSQDYEPVFINSTTSDEIPPIFSGIYLKKLGRILGLNGKTHKVKNG